jgi:hypothetical protein
MEPYGETDPAQRLTETRFAGRTGISTASVASLQRAESGTAPAAV